MSIVPPTHGVHHAKHNQCFHRRPKTATDTPSKESFLDQLSAFQAKNEFSTTTWGVFPLRFFDKAELAFHFRGLDSSNLNRARLQVQTIDHLDFSIVNPPWIPRCAFVNRRNSRTRIIVGNTGFFKKPMPPKYLHHLTRHITLARSVQRL